MSDLRERLARLGLSQYLDVFVNEGFDTWDTVLDVTESDLSHLNVKLGHRRKLQRAIAEWRGQSSDRPLPAALGRATSVEGSYRSEDSGAEGKSKQGESSTVGAHGTATKRKYRRHPKPDEHAPERPPSAYVIFSNHVRESLKGQDLSFTEIAKVVGERWQVLPVDEREGCERQANNAKEKYYTGLAEYKKTPQYQAYQKYLEEFKAKHATPTKGKRSKLEAEASTSTRSNSHDYHDRTSTKRPSPIQPELLGIASHITQPSLPAGSARLPTAPTFASKPTSPIGRSFSGFTSPKVGDQFSPMSASPKSATLHKEVSFDSAAMLSWDRKSLADTSLSYPSPMELHSQSASQTPPLHPYPANHPASVELPSRRVFRESARLPPLTRDDTTLSSESGHSGHSTSISGYPVQILPTNPTKPLRILPQPIPTTAPSPLPMDRLPSSLPTHPIPNPSFQTQPQDYRTQGPLAVLVRAGELAAKATDNEVPDEAGS